MDKLSHNLAEVGTDTISRQAALDCFHDWIDKHGNVYCADESEEYQRIETLPSVQPEPHWIPITDKLPDLDEYVLATTSWGAITIAERWKDTNGEEKWFFSEGECNAERDDIVAWKPLPEPYKGEANE